VTVRSALMDTTVRDVMSENPVTLSPNSTIRDAGEIFRRFSIDGIPVVDTEHLVMGMYTKSHMINSLMEGKNCESPIGEYMARDVLCIKPERSVYDICLLPVKRLPVVDGDGKLVGIITKTDLIKVFSADVRFIKERLATIIESTHNGIVAIDANGSVFTFNSAAEKILEIPAKEVIGRFINDLPADIGLFSVLTSARPEAGEQVTVGKKTLLINRTPILKDSEVIGAVGVFQDISEVDKISRQMDSFKRLSCELQAIIESSYDGICVTEADGKIEHLNSAYERLIGICREELIGKPFGEDLTDMVKQQKKAVTLVQKTATGKQVLITGNPLLDGDSRRLLKIVTNVRDITELSRLKQELDNSRELQERYSSELDYLRGEHTRHDNIVAKHPRMKNVIEQAMRAAAFDSTVLLLGETGVGKELFSKLIHGNSERRDGPFIKVNCSAIPEQLIESELFGYAPGAFTGANKNGKPGMFELAYKGTIFLDEIAELPLSLQAKLLRVLQEREILKVGGVNPQKVDVRIIAATNKDLEIMVEGGKFRNDLFYRLNVIPLTIPPLREHKEDIPLLIYTFMKKFNSQWGIDKKLTQAVVDSLMDYDWPGNIRELEHILERILVMSKDETIRVEDLPKSLRGNGVFSSAQEFAEKNIKILPLREAVDVLERNLIERAIEQCGSIRKAAKVLEVDPSTVVRKIERLNARY